MGGYSYITERGLGVQGLAATDPEVPGWGGGVYTGVQLHYHGEGGGRGGMQ